MIFQLADDSHEISHLIFVENWERCRKNLSSAAVVIGALRVNWQLHHKKLVQHKHIFSNAIMIMIISVLYQNWDDAAVS